MTSALLTLETLLRAKKLDVTLTSARPWSRDEREARLAPTGWSSVDDALGGGVPRGESSEIVGPASSGRTALLCALLAAAGARGEVTALVDTFDRFDPVSAAELGVDLSRLLWVRGAMIPPQSQPGFRGQPGFRSQPGVGGMTETVLARAIDRAIKSFGLVLQAGGFGVVALDLGDVPMRAVRRLPFTTWMRVQRLLEARDTVGVVLAQEPIARGARGVTVRLASTALTNPALTNPALTDPALTDPALTDTAQGKAGGHAAAVGEGASRASWLGAGSDRARLFTGFTLHPHIGAARRMARDVI